jgi:hypothetical protein
MNLLQHLLDALFGAQEHIIDIPILPGQTPEEVIHVLELAAEETGVELTHIEIIEREE